jgi:DNA-binding PadR family transcriptional regulator
MYNQIRLVKYDYLALPEYSRMDRKLLLLGLLRRQEMHGYQLNEFIEEKMHFCIDLKKPTAYYLLDKLAQEGLVEVEWSREGNRPPRRVYHITAAGEERFFQLLRRNLADHTPAYYPTDIGIAFMDQLPAAEVLDFLQQKRQKILERLDGLLTVKGHEGPLQYVLDHSVKILQAELDWLEGILEKVESAA